MVWESRWPVCRVRHAHRLELVRKPHPTALYGQHVARAECIVVRKPHPTRFGGQVCSAKIT